MTTNDIQALFRSHSFRATPQRIAVYKYLCDHHTHPDVDEIYRVMIKENPNFSPTTVYNALKALEKEGLIISVTIDKDRVHYDANIDTHGHFKCEKCGRIFDFGIYDIKFGGIDDFYIRQKDIYYSGVCPECK